MNQSHQQFLETLVGSMGCDPELLGRTGVTVAGDPSRAENHVTAGYAVRDHLVVTCDPAVEAMLTVATRDMAPTLQAWSAVAAANDGELLGSGRMQVLGDSQLPAIALAPGHTLRSLNPTVAADRALIEHFVEVSDEDDLDEAEIELDNLDDLIEVVLDESGAIASYASSHDFDLGPGFGDIGIMTRPESRGLGLGSAAVVAVCQRIRTEGHEPLYRCDEDNTGSIALSAALGFSIATQLVAYRFPA